MDVQGFDDPQVVVNPWLRSIWRPPSRNPKTAAPVVGRRSSPLGLTVPYLGGMEIGPSYRAARDGHRPSIAKAFGCTGLGRVALIKVARQSRWTCGN